jgi:hypothetical protein
MALDSEGCGYRAAQRGFKRVSRFNQARQESSAVRITGPGSVNGVNSNDGNLPKPVDLSAKDERPAITLLYRNDGRP